MFYDYYMQALNKDDMETGLIMADLATWASDDQTILITKPGVYLDDIGLIYKDLNTESDEVVLLDGYHFNLRTTFELSPEQQAFFTRKFPNTPSRVWS